MSELKPCPFCGRKKELVMAIFKIEYDLHFGLIECPCGALMKSAALPTYESAHKDIIDSWNNRVIENPWEDFANQVD